ncbi:MAG: hypothetical protein IKQ29_01180 [Bacilli bacterium]|nr:hypothetical protein [Bacilli bacterium]
MKKAIVPLTLLVFIILTIFVYINRFSVYYETQSDAFVFNDDTVSSNLTGGVTADSDEVTVVPVKLSQKIYLSNQRYFIGESSKKSISLDYPIVSDDNSTLYIQSELGKYVDTDFVKSDVKVDTVISNAVIYNGNSLMQIDDLTYNFLELNSGIYINLVKLTINTETHPYEIPVHSYIYFGDHYIRYYFLDGNNQFIYREIPNINETDLIELGDGSYKYGDFILLMGIQSIDASAPDPDKAVDPNGDGGEGENDKNKNKSKDTLKKRGQIIQTERYNPKDVEEKYVDPEVHITNLVVGVYSVRFDIEVYDPAKRITKAPTLSFYKEGATNPAPTKSYSSSGAQVVSGLHPDSNYGMRVVYEYKNEKGDINRDRGQGKSKETGKFRITINGIELHDFGEPYEFPLKTKDRSTLNPVSFTWNDPIPSIRSILWNNINISNPAGDEVLYGISSISVDLTNKADGKVTSLIFSRSQLAKIVKNNAIDFDTKDVLTSNTYYDMNLVVKDPTGYELPVVNGTKKNVKTLQTPPIATLAMAGENSATDFTKRIIDVKIINKDEVTFKQAADGYRFRYKVYVEKNGQEREVISGSFDDPERKNEFDTKITLNNLDILTRYYIRIYCDYVADGVVVPNYLMNKEFSITTGDIASLGTVLIRVEDKVVTASDVSFTASFVNLSDQLFDLMDTNVNIKIFDKKAKKYVLHSETANGSTVYTENFYVSKYELNNLTSVPASFNKDGSMDKILNSRTDYTIEILPTFTSGTQEQYVLNHSVLNADFTTLKKEATVRIKNAYKAAGYVDFDVCVEDPDEAVIADKYGQSFVSLDVKHGDDVYYSKTLNTVRSCSAEDGLYERLTISSLNKDLSDYVFTFNATAYNVGYDGKDYAKDVYANEFHVLGTSGIINLNKLIDNASYDLERLYWNDSSDHDEPDHINRFDIRNNTRWKSQSADSNAYDRKELLVDSNEVKLGSNKNSQYGYAIYIPELVGKPFTISFNVDVQRETTLNLSQQSFCINNGYNYKTCAAAGATGTGNLISSITTVDSRGVVHSEEFANRHVYSFDRLDSTGYITFYVQDSNPNRYNTDIILRDLKIEFGKPLSPDDTSFGTTDSINYGGDLPDYFVAFIDTGLDKKYCLDGMTSEECEALFDEYLPSVDPNEEEAHSGVLDGTSEIISGETRGSGEMYFNDWYKYDYYVRFFINGNEVKSLRRRILETCTDSVVSECFENDFASLLFDYDFVNAFVQSEVVRDKSYEIRITTVATHENGYDFSEAINDKYVVDKENSNIMKEMFRLYDIYSYTFSTEIESRSIATPEEFINMHAYGNYIVIADLDFTNKSNSSAYSGTFQGSIDFQGHKAVMATGSGMSYLFNSLGGGSRVKNLDLHIIFNHNKLLSGFHGLTNSNYGQVLNLMVSTVNDTIDEEKINADPDLSLLDHHVEFSYDLENGTPMGVEEIIRDGANKTIVYKDGYDETNTVVSDSFRTTYSALVAQINYGLIDGFVVKLKDPLYFHTNSAIVLNPHVSNAVNQGTIRNGYIYGEDMVAPIATTGEGRGLAIIATSASLNAVIENIYSLVNIKIYDNEVEFSDNTSNPARFCLEWKHTYKLNELGQCVDADDEVITDDEGNPISEGGSCIILSSECRSYVQKRVDNSYTGALILGSSSNAIVRNIISYGDILGYSNDRYNTNFDAEHDAISRLTLPEGSSSQDAVIANIYPTRDSSIPKASGSNIVNIYNVSTKNYSGAISKPITKLYFKDKMFLDEILNTHGVFLTNEAWRSSTFPHLVMPSCMPPQDFISVDNVKVDDGVIEVLAVESYTQNKADFATGFTNSTTYKSKYNAQVVLSVRAPIGKRIVGALIRDINFNETSTDLSNVAVEWGGTPNSDGITFVYLYIKDPFVYKNDYILTDLYYNDDGNSRFDSSTSKSCGGTGRQNGSIANGGALDCHNGSLNILLPMSLYMSVDSLENIKTGIANNTINFLLTKDLDCSDEKCRFSGDDKRPFIEKVEGMIDGGGHVISGLEVDNCLFGTVNGSIKNLTIDGFVNNYVSNNYAGTNYGKYGGLMCIMGSSAIVDNVHMSDVTVGAGGSGQLYVGGIVGYSNGGFIMNSSVYKFGLVKYRKNDDGDVVYSGGKPVIDVNNLVHMNNTSTLNLGGIVGYGKNLVINNVFVRYLSVNIERYSVVDGVTTYGPGDVAGVGGIVGFLEFGNIEDVYTTGDISTVFVNAGGIAGTNGGYIKSCISKINIVGTNYMGSIVGKVNDVVIPSNKIAKSLSLGDILTSSTDSKEVHRTSGSLIAMNGNYAWDKQSINSVYTKNTSGETLLTQEDMINPLVFANRIGLSNESWVLNYDYNCDVDPNGSSRCVEGGNFAKGFRVGKFVDADKPNEVVRFGYIPMIRNLATGEPLPNQGFYEGEEGYSTDKPLGDLEIRFVEMFTIKDLVVTYKKGYGQRKPDGTYDSYVPLSSNEPSYLADAADIQLKLHNPNGLGITVLEFDGLEQIGQPSVINDEANGDSMVSITAIPKYYYDSYQINTIHYVKNNADKTYSVPILLDITFYGKIYNKDDWNNIVAGRAQNYLVMNDVNFGCFDHSSCTVKSGLTFNKLRGVRQFANTSNERNPKLMNIKIENMGSATGLIDNVMVSMYDVDFENVLLSTTSSASGTNFGIIKTLDGLLKPSDSKVPITFTNIKIDAPKVERVGIIGTNRSNEIRDIVASNLNINGKKYVGGLIGYSQIKDKNNITIKNGYIVGSGDYVGGYMGYAENGKARTYDYNIAVEGIYSFGNSYVGGAVGAGSGNGYFVSGKNTPFPTDSTVPSDIYSGIDSNTTMNVVKGNGSNVGGVFGSTNSNSSSNLRSINLNITAAGNCAGGVTGVSSSISKLSSSFNKVQAANRAGGITGQVGDGTSEAVVVSNTIISKNEYAGGVAGVMGWTSIHNTQVTSETVGSNTKDTLVVGKTYVGGILGGMNSRKGNVYDNISTAVVVSTGTDAKGYVGGIIGFIPNKTEIQNDSYVYKVYGNYVANSVVVSETTLAGGLIGGWEKDSVVGTTEASSRIYSNSISVSVYCRDISYCGFINGGAKEPGYHNGDYLATSHYVTNRTYDHKYHPRSSTVSNPQVKYECPSGQTPSSQDDSSRCIQVKNATYNKETELYECAEGDLSGSKCYIDRGPATAYNYRTITYDCTGANTEQYGEYYLNTLIQIPYAILRGTASNSTIKTLVTASDTEVQNKITAAQNSAICNWRYAEADIDYPYVYKDIQINKDSVLGVVTGNETNYNVVSYSLANVPESNINSYDLAHDTVLSTGRYLTHAVSTQNTYGTYDYDLSELNNRTFVNNNATYFPHIKNGLTDLNPNPDGILAIPNPDLLDINGSIYTSFPTKYRIKKEYHKPNETGLPLYGSAAVQFNSINSGIPRVNVYASDVNKINVEFFDIDSATSSWFEINGVEYSIDKQTYTFYYDFESDFDITIGNYSGREVISIKAEDLVNSSTTIDDNYYYLDDGSVITNAELKSNGYEEIIEENTEDTSEEDNSSEAPELPIQPGDDGYNNIDSGLVTTSSRAYNNVVYKLAEVERTTEINNATNIFGDEILLDNKNIYNIKTGKTKIDDFENLTLAEDTPLYEFEYAGQVIKTYGSYSTIDGQVVNKKIYVKNNKLEVVDNGLESVSDSYIIDNYNDKEYMIYLGIDGKIHSLKDQIVLPKNFKNINIKSISSTIGNNTNIMFVEYKDGSYVAFNYRNGNIVGKETNKDVSLGEYIREYYQLSKDSNQYIEENKSYEEAKSLVRKLNEHPIETVIGEERYEGGIPAKNATYSIAYNPASDEYYVYQVPTAESTSEIKMADSFDETVDNIIDKDERLIEFYRSKESIKVTFVSALIIVLSIVGFIALSILILAKYLKNNETKIKEGK